MPPRLQALRSHQLFACSKQRTANSSQAVPLCLRVAQRRSITADEKPLPEADTAGPGPNQDQLPHVSEEAASLSKVTGEVGPDLEQGTPVQEVWLNPLMIHQTCSGLTLTSKILNRDEDAKMKAPQVMKDSMKSSPAIGTRSFSTSTKRMQEALISLEDEDIVTEGHKFGLPALPLHSMANIKHRYDPVVQQVTNLLMQDGKLSVAQRVRSSVPLPLHNKIILRSTPST